MPKLETLAIHSSKPDKTTGAVAPAIHLSTTFERAKDGSFPKGYIYTREDNPNRAALEKTMALIEGGEAAAAFASGSAAAAALFKALKPGDHLVIPDDMYHGLRALLHKVFVPWGLEVSTVDMTDQSALRAALKANTKLVWIETPSNPMLKITDIAAVCKLAKAKGALVACDNTWTPPALQPVFALGADFIVHASTKYLAGHSDVLGGVLVAKEQSEVLENIRFIQKKEGAVPSPFDCWLVSRGIKTLAYRMRAHSEHALAVAKFLASQPQVKEVYYPGLARHQGHGVATAQMRAFGGMLSFRLQNEAMAIKLAANLTLFTRATSLGGVESLIEHRASIEGPETKTPRDLLRVSVGLEHVDDLCADLAQGLASLA